MNLWVIDWLSHWWATPLIFLLLLLCLLFLLLLLGIQFPEIRVSSAYKVTKTINLPYHFRIEQRFPPNKQHTIRSQHVQLISNSSKYGSLRYDIASYLRSKIKLGSSVTVVEQKYLNIRSTHYIISNIGVELVSFRFGLSLLHWMPVIYIIGSQITI